MHGWLFTAAEAVTKRQSARSAIRGMFYLAGEGQVIAGSLTHYLTH